MKTKLVVVISLLFVASAWPAQSQDNSTSSSAETRPPVTSVDQQKSDYFYQLEKYRQAKQQFVLDRAEDYSLKTLATREKLVGSYKNLLTVRSNTLTTYLLPLRHLLFDTQGIDVGDKQKALGQIDESLQRLSSHQKNIPGLTDMNNVGNEATRFESEDVPVFLEASYRSLTLLAIGRIQSIADQVVVVSRDFTAEVVDIEVDANNKAVMERGMSEVARLQVDASEAIKQARTSFTGFDKEKREDGFNTQPIYQRVADQLNPAYTSLSRALDYLSELEKNS
ncbi:MAG: hypothetical protein ACD_83C00080G0004 [uncultured bacterium]|nr:MAG: hypothetical protein ACD_83C00080G0004 [uncultured bacterium]